jgi:hypothetical protein
MRKKNALSGFLFYDHVSNEARSLYVKGTALSKSHTEAQHDSIGNGKNLQGDILLFMVNYAYFVEQKPCLF